MCLILKKLNFRIEYITITAATTTLTFFLPLSLFPWPVFFFFCPSTLSFLHLEAVRIRHLKFSPMYWHNFWLLYNENIYYILCFSKVKLFTRLYVIFVFHIIVVLDTVSAVICIILTLAFSVSWCFVVCSFGLIRSRSWTIWIWGRSIQSWSHTEALT